MSYVTVEYLSIGGNRQSAATDWSRRSQLVAFGADHNVALWRPLDDAQRGITTLLRGHTDKVTSVRFAEDSSGDTESLVTGSADGEILLWKEDSSTTKWGSAVRCKAHDASVNCIGTVNSFSLVATGGADATVKLWTTASDKLKLLHTIKLVPRYIPLTLLLGKVDGDQQQDSLFLAVGGTRSSIQVFALTQFNTQPQHELHATLTGHEGWISSLALRSGQDGEMLLASASHDKYVRLWRLHKGDVMAAKTSLDQPDDLSPFEQTLTARSETVVVPGAKYSIAFEALLLGHEDWIYSAAWNPDPDSLQLLTASADGTLTIWEPDPSSGVWLSAARLGEISGQKGATTATGSAGGFWAGLWSLDGHAITSLGRSGSWRLWHYDRSLRYWVQKPGVSGFIGSATGLSWSEDGKYLLSTSSDQSTRLHAEWRRSQQRTWHEFARPQIHGYDLNCVTGINSRRFVSGADEKLLRVFEEPRAVAGMLERLCEIEPLGEDDLPDVATIPVLGLSNKATESNEPNGTLRDAETGNEGTTAPALLDIHEPPTEDLLARHTLWPELEKLYGHGYEISEAATSSEHGVLATACKASSLDHAVIRLYSTETWQEIKPPLSAHSLTVTRLAFSHSPTPYLLSVGRDRQWTVFGLDQGSKSWKMVQSSSKAHTRMILDCAWSPGSEGLLFATASRDKSVKLWSSPATAGKAVFQLKQTLKHKSPVTALSFTSGDWKDFAFLATGEEDGQISVHVVAIGDEVRVLQTVELEHDICLSKAVNRLAWRTSPADYAADAQGTQLALAGADGSVRILRIDLEAVLKSTEDVQ